MSIFEFFDFLHEVRTLKALQTGIEVALSEYLFYGQLWGQKVYVCLEFCLSHFLSGVRPLVPRGLSGKGLVFELWIKRLLTN